MNTACISRLACVVTLLMALITSSPVNAAPTVVVTIKPAHSLVASIMQDVATPILLFDKAVDSHRLVLRPSQARALANAEVVVRIGPQLEISLTQPIANLAVNARVIDLTSTPALHHLDARKGGLWLTQPREHQHVDDTSHHDDPHIWLSPDNARAIGRHLAHEFSRLDPANRGTYIRNLEQLLRKIDNTDFAIRKRLSPIVDRPYLVFHDAYQSFEEHYGVAAVGSVAVSAGRSPGAKRLRELRSLIRDSGAVCIFHEPQFKPKLVELLVDNTDTRSAVLDPLGATVPAGPEHWFTLMNHLADSLENCLGS